MARRSIWVAFGILGKKKKSETKAWSFLSYYCEYLKDT